MSFWNGANGSRHKSRSIAPRGLMFLLTREPLATGRVRPTADRTGVMSRLRYFAADTATYKC